MVMKKYLFLIAALVATSSVARADPQPGLPAVKAYMMSRDAEIALARTAAPNTISGTAYVGSQGKRHRVL